MKAGLQRMGEDENNVQRDAPPLKRIIRVGGVVSSDRDVDVVATPEELSAIANDYRLPEILALSGHYSLRAEGRGYRLIGYVEARIIQVCVVSLEPFEAQIREQVNLAFEEPVAGSSRGRPLDEPHDFDVADEDPPEALVDGQIDLGAVTLEFLALGLDSHPRKPGVVFNLDAIGDGEEASPFASLAGMRFPRDGHR